MGETALVGAPPATEVATVRGFTKRYGRRLAVDRVDLDVRPGEIYGLIGPDGAGKSSLMKAIAGVLTFDAGQVEVFGVSLETEAACERIKDRIGLMPQGLGLNLYPELSVEENIDFFARLRLVAEQDLAERKARLLAMTRLERFRDRPTKQLSGGMKQKLGLVCTLVHEPRFLILDEPTTGVDPVSRRDFWSILSELVAERGIATITLNDPPVNAYTHEMMKELDEAILEARFDEAVNFPNPRGDGTLSVLLRPYGEGMKLVLSQDITDRERNEAMRRDFVANVSHEIRTPLTVLAGFIETMGNLPLTEGERARVLELMTQQTQRMQTLVSDLLTLAQAGLLPNGAKAAKVIASGTVERALTLRGISATAGARAAIEAAGGRFAE